MTATFLKVFEKLHLRISSYQKEREGKEYEACQFVVNQHRIICRKAKLTPKKKGVFVTFWKRIGTGPIAPFHEMDSFNFYAIHVSLKTTEGVFIIPKSELLNHHLISSTQKEGKRGFRMYLPWETDLNKQATKSQAWQRQYYFDLKDESGQRAILQVFNT